MRLSVSKYAYISAKVKGMKLRLLSREAYEALLRCHDLSEVCTSLENTEYSLEIAEARLLGIQATTLERAFIKNLFKVFTKVAEKSPSEVRAFIAVNMRKFEIENVKAILRAVRAGLRPEEAMSFVIPVPFGLQSDAYESLLRKVGGVEDLVRRMEVTEYGPVLGDLLEDYAEKRSLLPLEAGLDRLLYGSLFSKMDKMAGRDRRIVADLLGTEVDLVNINVILRSKALRLRAEDAYRYVFPVFCHITEKQVGEAMNAQDVEGAITALTVRPYAEMLSKILLDYQDTGFLTDIDVEKDHLLLEASRSLRRMYLSPFHIGTILSFLNLKWFEVRNLRALVYGKEDGLPQEAIEKLLVY